MLSSFIIRLILIKRIINKKSWKIQLKLRYIIYNNLYNITNKLQIIDFFQNFLIILTCHLILSSHFYNMSNIKDIIQ